MSKNIIICSDGTGNTAIKNRGTNVFKLFEAVDLNGHRTDPNLPPQVALYDDGVGTESFLPLKLLGGAFGWGLKRNVLKLYTGLVRIYDPGDRIYLFGFSRGAFTVRTLAGLIAKCGVLDWDRMRTTDAMRAAVAQAYRTYRQGYRTWLWRILHGKSREEVQKSASVAMSKFKVEQQAHDTEIHFVGVWDTVDAVGGPFHISDVINTLFHRFKFPDHKLSDMVKHAVQALSIDDARAAFQPLLWEANPNVDQVWFAGVHSNVGGGYPKQGMSLVTLDWMMQKAGERGLRILLDDRKGYSEHGSVDDKLYDSRAGLGVFYRWMPRNMQKLSEKQKAGPLPRVHLSVLERIAHGTDGYAPGTLAPHVQVVYTPSGNPAQDQAAEVRTEAVNSALAIALSKTDTGLERVRPTLIVGQIAYYLYVASCLAVFLAASVPRNAGSRLNPGIVLKNAGGLIIDAVTGKWTPLLESAQRLLVDPWLLGTLAAGFAISAALAYYVDHTRSLAFSRFWHDSRHDLRKALKAARERLQADQSGPSPLSGASMKYPARVPENECMFDRLQPAEANSILKEFINSLESIGISMTAEAYDSIGKQTWSPNWTALYSILGSSPQLVVICAIYLVTFFALGPSGPSTFIVTAFLCVGGMTAVLGIYATSALIKEAQALRQRLDELAVELSSPKGGAVVAAAPAPGIVEQRGSTSAGAGA